MNILFVNASRIWGGNEKWTHMAVHELAKANNVFFAYRSPELGRQFSVAGIRLPFLNRLDFFSLVRLASYIKKNSISILVSTNRKFYLLGALSARLAGCRHFVRCGIVWKVPESIYYRTLFTKFVDGIIVNAEPVRARLARTPFIDEGKVHLVYNGLDVKKLDEARGVELDKPFAYTIVTMGELISRKGHAMLIRSFARFVKRQQETGVGLVIIGKGKQKAKLMNLSRELEVADRVVFTGFMENPYPLLAAADLYVSASANEGLSNSLLEAMYLKIPVITTRAGGVEDIINHGHNGFLVDDDEESFSRLFEDTLDTSPDLLKNMGVEAYRTVAARFSLSEMARQLEQKFAANS